MFLPLLLPLPSWVVFPESIKERDQYQIWLNGKLATHKYRGVWCYTVSMGTTYSIRTWRSYNTPRIWFRFTSHILSLTYHNLSTWSLLNLRILPWVLIQYQSLSNICNVHCRLEEIVRHRHSSRLQLTNESLSWQIQ